MEPKNLEVAFDQDRQDPKAALTRSWESIRSLLLQGEHWKGRLSKSHGLGELELELSTYEDYRSTLETSLNQTVSTLTAEPIQFWSQSSGSTGQPKLFPWTPAFQAQYLATSGQSFAYRLREFPSILEKGGIPLIAGNPRTASPAGIPMGTSSNHTFRLRFDPKHAPFPLEVLNDAETAQMWVPGFALARDTATLAALVPSVHLRLLNQVEAHRSEYLAYLSGKQPPPEPLGPLNVSAERLSYLTQVLSGSEPLTLKRLWPSLVLLSVWTSGPARMHLPELRERAGVGVALCDSPYMATEGVFTVIRSINADGGTLFVTGEICEFLEAGAAPDKDNLLSPWELDVGRLYEPVVTTRMGFVRYRMKDLVRCTGFDDRAPRLRFHGRAGREVSLGVATIGELECVEAMQESGVRVDGPWLVAPNSLGNGLTVYSTVSLDEPALRRFDRAMSNKNPVLAKNLRSGVIAPTRAETLPATHEVWELANPRHMQAKPRILFPDGIPKPELGE